ALRSQFHTLLSRARQRKGLRVFALGQRLRHFADRVTQSAGEATRRFCAGWPICTIWCPTSVGPSMPGSVVWKSKEAKSRHATGCSISKFSRLEAFDERCRTLPRNSVECEEFQ